MKKALTLILVFLSLFVFGQNKKNINHVLIIDKTASMVGKGDGNGVSIWRDVVDALKGYIDDVNMGDKITIYQFHGNLSDPRSVLISKNEDRATAKSFIDEIKPNGNNTCLYEALDVVLKQWDNGKYDIWMGIYTDGKDNCHTLTFQQIVEKFKLKKGDRDFAYYITIGKEVPEEIDTNSQNVITVLDEVRPGDIQKKANEAIEIEKRKQDSIRNQKKQDSIQKAQAEANAKADKEEQMKRDCINEGGNWICDNGECKCNKPITLLDIVFIVLGAIVLLLLVWFLFLKKKMFPRMSGKLLFGEDVQINLNDFYVYYLYSTDKVPSYAKTGFLAALFCGEKGHFQIPSTPDDLKDIKNYICIKPIKKRNLYMNDYKAFGNIEVDSEYKTLYHEQEYKIKNNDSATHFISFTYDNEKHSINY